MKKLVLFAIVSFFHLNDCIANQSFDFNGRWCGKWDNVYSTCFNIQMLEETIVAEYQWEEQIGGGWQKKQLIGKRLNINTIDFDGKIVVLDLKNPSKITALGIFKEHSRVAFLEKE